jgi:uncharacterized membrane protein
VIDGWLFVLTLVTALGCGLVAGFFFAYSASVMQALARRPPAEGLAAMQSINIVVINPLVMGALFGTALACIAVIVGAVLDWGDPHAVYLVIGAAVYLVGAILVTGAYNVPRNDAIAKLDPNSPDAAGAWNRYVQEWTAANHIRTLSSLAAATLLTIALRVS